MAETPSGTGYRGSLPGMENLETRSQSKATIGIMLVTGLMLWVQVTQNAFARWSDDDQHVYPNGAGPNHKMLTWNAKHCCGYAMQHDSQDIRL